jgi:hypothetical protein
MEASLKSRRPAGAYILAAFALAGWLGSIIALVNFYFGNTGLGRGGDTGMLSALVDSLAASAAIIATWLLLLALTITARARGGLPRFAFWAAVFVLPLSGWAALEAQARVTPSPEQTLRLGAPELYKNSGDASLWPRRPWAWPLVEPALVPPLFVALGLWALAPAARRRLQAPLAYAVALGGSTALSAFALLI